MCVCMCVCVCEDNNNSFSDNLQEVNDARKTEN